MSKRRSLPNRFGSTGGVVRAQTLVPSIASNSKLEEEEQRRKRESKVLEELRPQLVAGARIMFTSGVHGDVRGKFKCINQEGRILVIDDKTSLPLSCDPSQVKWVR